VGYINHPLNQKFFKGKLTSGNIPLGKDTMKKSNSGLTVGGHPGPMGHAGSTAKGKKRNFSKVAIKHAIAKGGAIKGGVV
jgi:hypothetical protein